MTWHNSWNCFDKEYCFKFVKFMLERINATIKAQGGNEVLGYSIIFSFVWLGTKIPLI